MDSARRCFGTGRRSGWRVAATVADAYVEVAVLTEVDVSAVVVAVGREDVVDQLLLACLVGGIAGHGEARYPIDTAAGLVGGVVEVNVVVTHEARVLSHP